MPLRRAKVEPEPPVMTWRKAAPVLAVAGIFDFLRLLCVFFWFLGPALAAIYCVNKVSGWVGSLWGLTATMCAATSGAAGIAASEITIPLGAILADAAALIGFLTLGMIIIMSNKRILKTVTSAPLQFTAAFGVSAIPFIGSVLPAFTFILWRLYRGQIRVEKAAHKKWGEETAAARKETRNQQQAQLLQQQAVIQAQTAQEAANDEAFAQTENEENISPEEEPLAA